MAIFRPSPIVGAISGSAGGVQFLTGANGPTVRARAGKRSQKTPPMLKEQAAYIGAVRAWQGLTDAQRQLWQAMAQLLTVQNRLGLPRHLSPFQTYMRAAIPTFLITGTYPGIPNVNLVSQAPGEYVFTSQTAAAINFTLDNVDPFAPLFFQVYVGFSVNHPLWRNARRERLVFAAAYDATPEIKLIPTWPEDFALPVTGWTIYIRTRVVGFGGWPGPSIKTDFVVG